MCEIRAWMCKDILRTYAPSKVVTFPIRAIPRGHVVRQHGCYDETPELLKPARQTSYPRCIPGYYSTTFTSSCASNTWSVCGRPQNVVVERWQRGGCKKPIHVDKRHYAARFSASRRFVSVFHEVDLSCISAIKRQSCKEYACLNLWPDGRF